MKKILALIAALLVTGTAFSAPAWKGPSISILNTITGAFTIVNPITPPTSSAACVKGTIIWDSGFLYVCVATNTWKRVAVATW